MGFEAVPGSTVAELVTHLTNFEGSPRKDGVDALTQWVLRIGGKLRDPEMSVHAQPFKPALNWMTRAFLKQVEEMAAAHKERPAGQEEREFLEARYGTQERRIA